MLTGRHFPALTRAHSFGLMAYAQNLQTYPFVQIPKVFLTRLKPSPCAIAAYLAINYFASGKNGVSRNTSIPRMAALVGLSPNTFRKGVLDLKKLGAVRVHTRMKKLASGKRVPFPHVYEIIDLQPLPDDKDF